MNGNPTNRATDATTSLRPRGRIVQTYATIVVGTVVALVANLVSYLANRCPDSIDDCGFRFGFPFRFYIGGGFVGLGEINWLAVIVDAVSACGLAFGVVWFGGRILEARRISLARGRELRRPESSS